MNFYSSPGVPRKPQGKIIERFFFIHRTAVVIRTSMRLSTGLFTAYPQVSPCVTECFLLIKRDRHKTDRAPRQAGGTARLLGSGSQRLLDGGSARLLDGGQVSARRRAGLC